MITFCAGLLLWICRVEGLLDILQLHVSPGEVDPYARADRIGRVGAVVEDPPVRVDVGAAHLGQLAGHRACAVLVVGFELQDPQDAERHVAGQEVGLYVLRGRAIDGAGLQVALRDLEGLLDSP